MGSSLHGTPQPPEERWDTFRSTTAISWGRVSYIESTATAGPSGRSANVADFGMTR